jgi:molecular chaperone Hsp31 and glyoxalase 3
MSWRVANTCAERKFGSATRKQIIMFLADGASDDGSGIWCSKGTGQHHTELGASTVIPGSHGAMLGLPDNTDVGKVLHWAHDRDLYTLVLCHGPAALLAAKNDRGFLYAGYKMTVFPDSVDKQTPMIGYLPGPMPWWVCEKLSALGAEIINTKADNSCHVDRRLISGASPKAANDFGRLAATNLLKAVQ